MVEILGGKINCRRKFELEKLMNSDLNNMIDFLKEKFDERDLELEKLK